jgi:hypothetical protein
MGIKTVIGESHQKKKAIAPQSMDQDTCIQTPQKALLDVLLPKLCIIVFIGVDVII